MAELRRMDFYGEKPVLARTIRKLKRWWKSGKEIDPWLAFPQNMCCYYYKRESIGYALPIGVLKILWEKAPDFTETCLDCNSKCYAVAFGGLLHQAAIIYVCTRCNHCWYKSYGGGFVGMGQRMSRPLKESEFCKSGGWYGGAEASSGKELLKVLRVRGEAELLGNVSLTIDFSKKN